MEALGLISGIIGLLVTVCAAVFAFIQARKTNNILTEIGGKTTTLGEQTERLSSLSGAINKKTDALAGLAEESRSRQSATVQKIERINDEIQQSVHKHHVQVDTLGQLIAYMWVASHVFKESDSVYLVNFAFKFGRAHEVSEKTRADFFEAAKQIVERPEFFRTDLFERVLTFQNDPAGLFNTAVNSIHDNLLFRASRPHFGAVLLDEEHFETEFLSKLAGEKNDKYAGYGALTEERQRKIIFEEERRARQNALEAVSGSGTAEIITVDELPIQFICGKLSDSNAYYRSVVGKDDAADERDRWLTLILYVGSNTLFNDGGDTESLDSDDYLPNRPSSALGLYTRSSRYPLVCLHIYGWLRSNHRKVVG